MKKILLVTCFVMVLSLGIFAQNAVGTWNYYYDWSCNGGYSSTTITFKADGTFTTQTYSGKWYLVQGYIMWIYPSGTTYSGTIIGGAMNGMMNASGMTGCWYCTKQNYFAPRVMSIRGEKDFDVSGKNVHPNPNPNK